MQRTIARWLIEHDAEATRQCYAQLPTGTGCRCTQCRNFDQAVDQAFPTEFRALAAELGVDVSKPAELCHWCREPSGLYLTAGWFHLVGFILAGKDVIEMATGVFRFEQLVTGFEFGLGARLALVGEPFTGHQLVQLEFQTRVPWMLAEPEPENV